MEMRESLGFGAGEVGCSIFHMCESVYFASSVKIPWRGGKGEKESSGKRKGRFSVQFLK